MAGMSLVAALLGGNFKLTYQPINAITRKPYNGGNIDTLEAAAERLHGLNDPRWMTFLQAKTLGLKVKSDMFAPNRGRFSVDELPRKRAVRFNTRAMQIPDEFAAGMKSGLTSPSRPWFTLTLYDTGLAKVEGIKAWLTEVQDIMQGTMIRSNLYYQLYFRISCSLMTSVHNARVHYGRNSLRAFRYA